ncbi:MAG: DUF1801 domain-containing protein [Planctomycetota bacterium]|jgi:uncharacterized protein YdhG (YjbR/CyaY superfamily)|nr:DUF1801 domain-containing protein [Planctomycetota bacterium]
MKSEAKSVASYLADLPEDRRKALKKIRAVIRKHLPKGYQETMNWGMIAYEVPLRVCPDTYNGQPLMYAALASQKRHMAVYLSGLYTSPKLQKRFDARLKKEGPKVDRGKSCLRFKTLDDLPIELIGEIIAAVPLDDFVAMCQKPRSKG